MLCCLFPWPVQASDYTNLVAKSQVLLRGNLLPVKELHKQRGKPSVDLLELLTSYPLPPHATGDLRLNLALARTQGLEGKHFSFTLFEQEQAEHHASANFLRFLHGRYATQFPKTSLACEITSIKRSGIELGAKFSTILGFSGKASLRYWDVERYERTHFSGQGSISDYQPHITGTLSHYQHSLEAFREESYVGYGLALSLDLYKELRPGTVLFIEDYALYAGDILHNVGVLQGALQSDREYFDPDDFLNYDALIKGRYQYQNLKLPVENRFVYGIQRRIGESSQVQLSLDQSFNPQFQLALGHGDWQITTSYLHPSLYYLEAAKNTIAAGLYLGGTFETGLTSLGLALRGYFYF